MRKFNFFCFTVFVFGVISCSDDDGWSIACPEGMVGFQGPNGDLCIDSLEALNSEYAAFLTENGNTCGGNQECMHIDEPGSHISQTGNMFTAAEGYGGLPVVQVTFRGADEYCSSISKFLCPDAMWVAACRGSGDSDYPYGSAYDSQVCNGSDAAEEAPLAAGSLTACEGGSDGLFDMSGNVYEWTDACGDGDCLIRGGSFGASAAELACGASHTLDGPSGHREDLGLRCCASPL